MYLELIVIVMDDPIHAMFHPFPFFLIEDGIQWYENKQRHGILIIYLVYLLCFGNRDIALIVHK